MRSIWQWRIATFVMVFVAIGFAIWAAQAQEKDPPEPKAKVSHEKILTITETDLNRLVEQRIAQQMIADEKTLDDKILDSANWHTAIYRGQEYTIYIGPGTVVGVQPCKEESKK